MARSTFTINEPGHKRWYLPDGIHQYNGVIFGDELRVSVLDKDLKVVAGTSQVWSLFKDAWQKEDWAHQAEMRKKFPAKRLEFLVSSQGGGSVDITLWGNSITHYNTLAEEEQRKFVLHEAWRKLWDGDAHDMLQALCKRLSVDTVKGMFYENAEITEL